MNINYKQPQFELFSAKTSTYDDANKPRIFLANLTLSFESLVILSILGIMVALFSFCLGVERGKHAAAQALDERVAAVQPTISAGLRPASPAKRGERNWPVSRPMPVAVMPRPAVVQSALVSLRPAAATGTRFTLQVASYKNEEYARTEASALRAKGYQSFLIKRSDFILVCIGQFANAEAAGAQLKKLPPQYRTGQVRRF